MKRIIMIICILMATASDALPCRPLVTEDCGTTPINKLSMEVGFEFTMPENTNTDYTVTNVFNYGLSDNLDAGIEIPLVNLTQDTYGIGDITLRSKYLILPENDTRPAMLVKLALKTPSGSESKSLGSGKTDAGLLFVITKSFGDLTLFANGGYNVIDLPKSDIWNDNSGFFGIGLQQAIGKDLTLLGEITSEPYWGTDFSDNPVTGAVGITWGINQKVTMDFAVRLGLNDSNRDYAVINGISINF
ncbi:MAG: transporter [Planctomycetes bacterium]|nr:transporter [Planctomycetota bacterium]